jgi:hypothetical protein
MATELRKRMRLPWSIALAVVSVTLAACGGIGTGGPPSGNASPPATGSCGPLCGVGSLPPQNEARGPCTLQLIPAGGRDPLEAPYVLTMTPGAGEMPATADAMWRASGWQGIIATRSTGPNGSLGDVGIDAPSLNGGMSGIYFDSPGAWVVELEDARCYQRLNIEVRPPPQ